MAKQTYVALLRGINVGGKNKVDMKTLKKTFEAAKATNVKTYINSGNIIFKDTRDKKTLQKVLQKAILKDFSLKIKVVIRSFADIKKVTKALPDSWQNDKESKTDVLFLWEEIDNKKVIEQLTIKEDIDTVKYIPGVVLWHIQRKNLTKSGLVKLVGSKIYKQMTIRNVNTTRKIHALMQEINKK